LEQELAAGLGEGQIAEFIQDDKIHAGQVIGNPTRAGVAGLGVANRTVVTFGRRFIRKCVAPIRSESVGHLEKFLSPSPRESDSGPHVVMSGWSERVMGQKGFFDFERRLQAISA